MENELVSHFTQIAKQGYTREQLKFYLDVSQESNLTQIQKHLAMYKEEKFGESLLTESNEKTVPGGVTKVDFKWWGFTLYIKHDDVQKMKNPQQAIEFLISLLPVIGKYAKYIVKAFFWLMKKFDKGDGVKIKFVYPALPVWIKSQ